MFTSRAEYRLLLRHDTADQRLTPKGYQVGLQSGEALERLKRKMEGIDAVKELLRSRSYAQKNALQALKMPEVEIDQMVGAIPELAGYDESVRYQVELDVKYQGYIDREDREISRFERLEGMAIPAGFDYDKVQGLSFESREKLKKVLPISVGQASRVNGVRMSDIALLILHLQRKEHIHA